MPPHSICNAMTTIPTSADLFRYHCRRVYFGLLLRCDRYHLAGKHAWQEEDNIYWKLHNDSRRCYTMFFLQPRPAHRIAIAHGVRQWNGKLCTLTTETVPQLTADQNTSTVPTWQAETSKSHRRGQMVMIEGSLIVFGVMISCRPLPSRLNLLADAE